MLLEGWLKPPENRYSGKTLSWDGPCRLLLAHLVSALSLEYLGANTFPVSRTGSAGVANYFLNILFLEVGYAVLSWFPSL